MDWTVAEMVEAVAGRLLSGDERATVARIATDTRTIGAGDAFVALLGERDGHDFIPDALAKGAKALVVREDHPLPPIPPEIGVVAVADTLYALGELARRRRSKFSIPVVGITGSNGKTSTKEMVAAILGQNAKVLKNHGNFNNLIGAPLTLLSLEPAHRVAVVEMGINVPGEMARLAEICRPGIALITNIHTAHLEGLRSVERVLEEKGKLWESLRPEDTAVVNVDDEHLARFAGRIAARKITCSLSDTAADVHVAGNVHTEDLESVFDLVMAGEAHSVRLPVLGIHQVRNAVAAAAVACALGVSPEAVVRGLALHRPVNQRMQVHRLADGMVLVDDTYNANPASMLAAVKAVASARGASPFVAVLGEMRELGAGSAALHRQLGERIGETGVDMLITLGDLAAEIAEGAKRSGIPADACCHARSHEDAVSLLTGPGLRSRGLGGAWVLVKGSRGMAMERIVKGLMNGTV